MLRHRSLRARLLAACLVTTALGLIVADLVLYASLRSFLVGQVDARLGDAAETVEHAVPAAGEVDHDDLAAADQGGLLAPGMYVERHRADGSVVTFGGRASLRPVLPDPLPVPSAVDAGAVRRGVHATFRAANAEPGASDLLVRAQRGDAPGALVIVAMPLQDVDDILHRLVTVEAIVTAGLLAAAAGVGLVLVRAGLRPLDDIGATASAFAAGDLTRRVARADGDTEIGRLGRSLNEMLQQIETAVAVRDVAQERLRRFVADASHELRTPLAAVEAYTELTQRSLASHPGDAARQLDRARFESRRLGVLVEDLLLLSRLDQGRPLAREPVDLGLVATEAVDAARAVDPDRPVRLAVAGLVEVTGDRDRLRQMLDNLLGNGRQHTPPGTALTVEVGADPEVGQAVLRVADEGLGIGVGEAELIFERFYRGDGSRARTGRGPDGLPVVSGTGLGLAIVRAIVEAHGGTIEVSRPAGGGTAFTVTLALLNAVVFAEPGNRLGID